MHDTSQRLQVFFSQIFKLRNFASLNVDKVLNKRSKSFAGRFSDIMI